MSFQDQVAEFEKEQKEIMDLERQLHNRVEEYKAQMRATFGIADGDKTNVLDLVKAIKKIQAAE